MQLAELSFLCVDQGDWDSSKCPNIQQGEGQWNHPLDEEWIWNISCLLNFGSIHRPESGTLWNLLWPQAGIGRGSNILLLSKSCVNLQISWTCREKRQEEGWLQLTVRCALAKKRMVSSLQGMLMYLTLNSPSGTNSPTNSRSLFCPGRGGCRLCGLMCQLYLLQSRTLKPALQRVISWSLHVPHSTEQRGWNGDTSACRHLRGHLFMFFFDIWHFAGLSLVVLLHLA